MKYKIWIHLVSTLLCISLMADTGMICAAEEAATVEADTNIMKTEEEVANINVDVNMMKVDEEDITIKCGQQQPIYTPCSTPANATFNQITVPGCMNGNLCFPYFASYGSFTEKAQPVGLGASWTVNNMDAVLVDPNGNFDTLTGLYTVPVTGYYLVIFSTNVVISSSVLNASGCQFFITINGALGNAQESDVGNGVAGGGTPFEDAMCMARIIHPSAGDKIQIVARSFISNQGALILYKPSITIALISKL